MNARTKHIEELADLLVGEGMDKEAVDLSQLRKAYSAMVKPRVFKSTASEAKATRRLHKVLERRGAPEALINQLKQGEISAAFSTANLPPRGAAAHHTEQMLGPYLTPSELRKAQRQAESQLGRLRARSSQPVISMPKDQVTAFNQHAGLYSPNVTGESREVFNRAIGLHEAREVRALNRSASRHMGMGGPTFHSHLGPDPMLNDVIIANTLKGEGAQGAKDLIMRARRGELYSLRRALKGDPKSVELVDRLLAGGSINRHGRKYLDRAHAKMLNDAKRGLSKQSSYSLAGAGAGALLGGGVGYLSGEGSLYDRRHRIALGVGLGGLGGLGVGRMVGGGTPRGGGAVEAAHQAEVNRKSVQQAVRQQEQQVGGAMEDARGLVDDLDEAISALRAKTDSIYGRANDLMGRADAMLR